MDRDQSALQLSGHLKRMVVLRGAALAHDTIMGSAAFFLALVLRLDVEAVLLDLQTYLFATAIFGVVVGLVGFVVGLNRGIWRYASLPDLLAIIKTATIAVGVFTVAYFLLIRLEAIPRSVPVISWAFTIVLLAGPRAVYRMYRNSRDRQRSQGRQQKTAKRVILVGASDNADTFLKILEERSSSVFDVVAIIDERGRRVGRFIRGVPIIGPVERIPEIVQRFAAQGRPIDAAILTRPKPEFDKHYPLTKLVDTLLEQRLELLRLPEVFDVHELGTEIEVRPVGIEDLLQRRPVQLERDSIRQLVKGRRVLVTGAGGSIGSELVRQIAELKPAGLALVDASEFALYTIDLELRNTRPAFPVTSLLGNVRDREAISRVLESYKPHIVFHAAALKHVPMVEMQPLEGIYTNAIGTRNVAQAAVRAGAEAMVLLSTDKAVNPVNVMGASKRLAEMLCQSMDLNRVENGTRFLTVRFGNVLGSDGSVIPLFREQLKAGGPLTVTHPDIERYFMTIPEACELVLEAAALGLRRPEENGRIFVLEMGAPVKIVDLARDLIKLSGYRPDIDIKIVFTGLRPGEKLYEELFDSREVLAQTTIPSVVEAFPRSVEYAIVIRVLDEMERMVKAGDTPGALKLLGTIVPEYQPVQPLAREPDLILKALEWAQDATPRVGQIEDARARS